MTGVDSLSTYPRAIIHVDGDAFFASCEVARNPKLKGLPVVVGGIRGIAVALTYEAKALGVTRGMPVFQIKSMFPSVVVLPGDYDLYEQFAQRMYTIVHRYSVQVEEYSIDECFADITNMRQSLKMSYEDIARTIKHDLDTELGITFSVGLATTKVLAKVASKHSKPSGLVFIPHGSERKYLEGLKVGKVWGIGPATAEFLYKNKIFTAQEFVDKPEWWIKESMAKPHRTIWAELRGTHIYSVDPDSHAEQLSVASTRTFRPPTTDKSFIFSQLSKNIEEACRRARAKGLVSKHVYCFLKSQEFQYLRFEVALNASTNIPSVVLDAVRPLFAKLFRPGIVYRATGVTLSDMQQNSVEQLDLFGATDVAHTKTELFNTLDAIDHKYGSHTMHLASSMKALKHSGAPTPHGTSVPYLGEVT